DLRHLFLPSGVQPAPVGTGRDDLDLPRSAPRRRHRPGQPVPPAPEGLAPCPIPVASSIPVVTRSACGLASVPTYGRPRSSPALPEGSAVAKAAGRSRRDQMNKCGIRLGPAPPYVLGLLGSRPGPIAEPVQLVQRG